MNKKNILKIALTIVASTTLINISAFFGPRYDPGASAFGGAATGAMIGGLAGGRRGAGIGAAVGLGAGLMSSAAARDDSYYRDRRYYRDRDYRDRKYRNKRERIRQLEEENQNLRNQLNQ